jgi:hypothetical protein
LGGFVDEDGEVGVVMLVEFGLVLPGEGDGDAARFYGGGEGFFGAVGDVEVIALHDGDLRVGVKAVEHEAYVVGADDGLGWDGGGVGGGRQEKESEEGEVFHDVR